MDFDSLKEKCEYYKELANYKLLPNSYVLFHLDGRSFSKMVKNKFEKPFDFDFVKAMNETMKYLCTKVQGVVFGYCQSDEISLIIRDFNEDGLATSSFFGYRLCKMQSIAASIATAKFNQIMLLNRMEHVPDCASSREVLNMCLDEVETMPLYEFDCKAWNVPSANDAYAWILYRQHDCVRNSKQQAAQTYISHKDLLSLDSDKQIALLKERTGIDWNTDYKDGVKYGRMCTKKEVLHQNDEKYIINDVEYSGKSFIRNEWVVEDCSPFDKDDENGYGEQILNIITAK